MARPVFLAALLMLTACAQGANAPPSLGQRAIEKAPERPEIVAPVASPAPASAQLTARLAQLLSDIRAGNVAFQRIEAREAGALRGVSAARGSETWALAQQAVSALLIARQQSASALAELDSLAIETARAAANDSSSGGLTEIAAARIEGETIVNRQNAVIDALTR